MALNQRQIISTPFPVHGNVGNASNVLLRSAEQQQHLGDFPLSWSKAEEQLLPRGQTLGFTHQHPNAEHSDVPLALVKQDRHPLTQGGSGLEGASLCEKGFAELVLNEMG